MCRIAKFGAVFSIPLKYGSIFIIVVMSCMASYSQTALIPKQYLKIIPAVSTREDVEKIYGTADPKKSVVVYQVPDVVVTVLYSYGGCDLGKAPWAVPKGVVEEIAYSPREEKPLRLTDVILDRRKFTKRQAGDVIDQVEYRNSYYGIEVVYDLTEKTVTDIIIGLSARQKKRFACPKGIDKITGGYNIGLPPGR
jgi:hypothetical protein